MRLLLPIILAVLGMVGGGAVGYLMKAEPEPSEIAAEADAAALAKKDGEHAAENKRRAADIADGLQLATDSAYVRVEQKLIVPIRRANGRKAFVAMDATLEIDPEKEEWIKSHEPKTIDAFLRVLIAFAATGAFDDHAETAMALDDLNDALLTSAHSVLGESVRAVLISNLITQDA